MTPTLPSIARYLLASGAALWLLVMVLQPDVGFRAPLPWMGLFWALQIGIGLALLQAVLFLSTRRFGAARWPTWLLVPASGILGSVLLAPLYWLIGEGLMQQVLGFPEVLDDGQQAPVAGLWPALGQEFLDIVGPVTAAWALVSLPRLGGLVPPLVVGPDPGPMLPGAGPAPAAPQAPASEDALPGWRGRLPPALGQDVIAVASELQYLRVWTTRGCALVLGALQEVEDTEGDLGLRVHRSWWVASRHVQALRRKGDATLCRMSDGRDVPVSRRRRAEAVARFGDSARYLTPPPDAPGDAA